MPDQQNHLIPEGPGWRLNPDDPNADSPCFASLAIVATDMRPEGGTVVSLVIYTTDFDRKNRMETGIELTLGDMAQLLGQLNKMMWTATAHGPYDED